MAKPIKHKKLTLEQRVDAYFAEWGNDKNSFISVIRQLTFLVGVIASTLVAVWIFMTTTAYFVNKDAFMTVTKNITILSITFIGFVLALDLTYLITQLLCYNQYKKNIIPSLLVLATACLLTIVFLTLTCVEIYGSHHAERNYIYCIYMTICLSCMLFSTVYCFDLSKKHQKYNPNNKLLKSLGYTIGYLSAFTVICYIFFVMWYASNNERLTYTCFVFGRIIISLVISVIVKLVGIILLLIFVNKSINRKKRIAYFATFAILLEGFVIWIGYMFLKEDGAWITQQMATKAGMTTMVSLVLAVGGLSIAFGSRYAVHLQKEDN